MLADLLSAGVELLVGHVEGLSTAVTLVVVAHYLGKASAVTAIIVHLRLLAVLLAAGVVFGVVDLGTLLGGLGQLLEFLAGVAAAA